MIKGVDVSSYQGKIDWNRVRKTGVSFAILKVVRKDGGADKQFENNWVGCNNAGIPVEGVYNYSYATTVAKAQSDAHRVIEILNGRRTVVWMDVEDKCLKGLGRKLINIINAYAKVIKDAGLPFGVYTGKDFYKSYLAAYASDLPYDFWLARYPSGAKIPITTTPNEMYNPKSVLVAPSKFYGWQFSSKGAVDGIPADVDMNIVYGSEPTVNETTQTATPAPAPAAPQQHIQPNYQAGQAYYVTVSNLRIRKSPSTDGKVIGSISNRAVGNKATTRDSKGWIWMNISGTNTPEWICADNGTTSFVI